MKNLEHDLPDIDANDYCSEDLFKNPQHKRYKYEAADDEAEAKASASFLLPHSEPRLEAFTGVFERRHPETDNIDK